MVVGEEAADREVVAGGATAEVFQSVRSITDWRFPKGLGSPDMLCWLSLPVTEETAVCK